jgi:hypothetical protein
LDDEGQGRSGLPKAYGMTDLANKWAQLKERWRREDEGIPVIAVVPDIRLGKTARERLKKPLTVRVAEVVNYKNALEFKVPASVEMYAIKTRLVE